MSCAPSPLAIASRFAGQLLRRRHRRARRTLDVGPAVWCCDHDRARRRRRVGVEGELVGGEVRARVVEDVPVAGRGREHHDHRDEHADADRRQRRARARPVPGEIAQRESGRDRRAPAEPRGQRQEERREQDSPGMSSTSPKRSSGAPPLPLPWFVPPGVAEQQERQRRGRRCPGPPSGGSGEAAPVGPTAPGRSAPW